MKPDFASHLRAFLLTYLRDQRALSPLTLKSYRDTFQLLMGFLAARRRPHGALAVRHLDVKTILAFLQHLEDKLHGRGNNPLTRNQRLAAIQSFFKYLLIT
ncbi:MAG: site-specific integrase [Elusimicrobia bacterium]|nr:site-specific integrase [Elusimicrobiota bacterium]